MAVHCCQRTASSVSNCDCGIRVTEEVPRSRTGGLGVRNDIENAPALQEGGNWTQRQGAVRRLAWTASCCLAAESRGSRSNLVVVGEARIERAQWEYPFRTGTVRLTWWLEGRVEGDTFWLWPSHGDEPHCLSASQTDFLAC